MAIFGLPGGGEGLLLFGMAVLILVFPVWPLWRICQKLNYPGFMSALWLVPYVGAAILLLVLAFGPDRSGVPSDDTASADS